jgi:photosystem II stability/assembly factor-like uncharacterized protein
VLAGVLALSSVVVAQTSSLRWAGLVSDAFTIDGQKVWAVEDGGRIRHRSASGTWSFQTTPPEVEDSLRRVHFFEDGLNGYAVGQNGWVLRTTDGGANWNVFHRQDAAFGSGFEDLWDVYAVSPNEGFYVGLKGIWWFRPKVSPPFFEFIPASFVNQQGQGINALNLELYSIDIRTGPGGHGLACCQPGLIFKQDPFSPSLWRQVFDIRSLCSANGGVGLPTCVENGVCPNGGGFEMWDVRISRHATEDLALAVGGFGTGCGVVLASLDKGVTWRLEPHECRCPIGAGCTSCNTDPNYSEPGNAQSQWRLKKFHELYNVSIFHGDNSAIACGYSGQIVVRDPTVDTDPVTPGVQALWRDRSQYTNVPLQTPSAVTLPGYGVASNSGNAANGIGYATSMGGYIRRTTDGGQNWTLEPGPVTAEPWRLRDVQFRSSTHGWMVGQFHRIARTTNGGATWLQDESNAAMNKQSLNAIALDGVGSMGVAVGAYEEPLGKFPVILGNVDLSVTTESWRAPTEIIPAEPDLAVTSRFNDVDWVSGSEFWAVGDAGLVLYSDPAIGLDLWRQFLPDEPYSTFSNFDIHGVSFATSRHGLLVGRRTVSGVASAKAYHANRSGNEPKWTEISIPNEPTLIRLTDVDFDGSNAFATGIRSVGGVDVGVVLKATLTNGVFSSFVAAAQTFPSCAVGEVPTAVDVLTEVEIAPGGAIWVGGQCGRLWRSADGNAWAGVRSMTDAHVLGMSFPAQDLGYIAGHRANRTGHSIVRIVP